MRKFAARDCGLIVEEKGASVALHFRLARSYAAGARVMARRLAGQTGLFLQPTYFPLVEYSRQRGNTALDVWVSSPSYVIQNRPQPVRYLDVSATFDQGARRVHLNVLNRSKDKDITTTIENQAGTLDGQVSVWQMNHPDLKATHTFGDDRKVRPVTRAMTAALRDGDFSYTFPAHSLTILTMTLR